MTTADLLAQLNALRVAISMKPLKAWKESRAKLEAAIATLKDEADVKADPSLGPTPIVETDPVKEFIAKNGVTKCPPPKALQTEAERRAAVAAAAEKLSKGEVSESVHKHRSTPFVGKDTVALVDIARELRLNPKIARAKMRRVSVPADYIVEGAKHVYKRQHKDWVVNILKSDLRKEKKG